MKRILQALCGFMWLPTGLAAGLPDCLVQHSVPIVVRIGADAAPTRAELRGGASPRITLVEAETGRVLWTAADALPATQLFADMRQPHIDP